MALKALSRTPNYVRRFGALHGLTLLLSIERSLPLKSDVVRHYDVAGYPRIYLRDSVSDHAIFWQCLVQCHYDFFAFPQSKRLRASYEAAIQSGRTPLIIDCGANIGLASVWLAQRFPEARVVAVEPDAGNFRLLESNTAFFGDRITCVKGGIWPERGFLRIVNPESGSAAFRLDAAPRSEGAIRAYTVADICDMAGVEAPFVVKLDIEGGQRALFTANTRWVERTHLITLELDDWLMPWKGTSRTFFSCLSKHAFDYVIGGESLFCFRDFEAEPSGGGSVS